MTHPVKNKPQFESLSSSLSAEKRVGARRLKGWAGGTAPGGGGGGGGAGSDSDSGGSSCRSSPTTSPYSGHRPLTASSSMNELAEADQQLHSREYCTHTHPPTRTLCFTHSMLRAHTHPCSHKDTQTSDTLRTLHTTLTLRLHTYTHTHTRTRECVK